MAKKIQTFLVMQKDASIYSNCLKQMNCALLEHTDTPFLQKTTQSPYRAIIGDDMLYKAGSGVCNCCLLAYTNNIFFSVRYKRLVQIYLSWISKRGTNQMKIKLAPKTYNQSEKKCIRVAKFVYYLISGIIWNGRIQKIRSKLCNRSFMCFFCLFLLYCLAYFEG